MVDLRIIDDVKERRKEHGEWLAHHLRCRGNVDYAFDPPKYYGHRWRRHWWNGKLRVWVWGPCEHCGRYRITDVYGNCIVLSPNLMIEDYLIVNDKFDDVVGIARRVIREDILGVENEKKRKG